MFDVGFSEILMVGLVALLVIGPEKLPKAARIAGFWLGKTRSTIANVKAEIKQEFHAEEMRQLLKNQLEDEDFHKTVVDGNAAIKDINAAMEALADTKIDRPDDKPI